MQKVKSLMEARSMRTADLARKTGLHPSRFSRWFDSVGEPSLDQYRLIAEALDVSIDELAGTRPSGPELSQDDLIILTMVRDLGHGEARRRLLAVPGSGLVFQTTTRPEPRSDSTNVRPPTRNSDPQLPE